ncbi:MAG: hypothetical protein EBT17_02345 [Actinobacteria bacterium]|nr:hypothetical protein [Actinomycetota bacterium]
MTKRPRRGARDQRRAPRGNSERRGRGDGQQPGRSDGKRRGRSDARPRDNDRSLGGEQIEGRQAVRELLIAQRRRVHEILVADDIERNPVIAEISDLAGAQRVALRRLPRRDIDEMARSEAPQGVIARAEPLDEVLLDEVLLRTQTDVSEATPPATAGRAAGAAAGPLAAAGAGNKLFLVAVDGVTDPGNLGAILRSCEGAGVDAVILPRHRAVHITPSAAFNNYVMQMSGSSASMMLPTSHSSVWVTWRANTFASCSAQKAPAYRDSCVSAAISSCRFR